MIADSGSTNASQLFIRSHNGPNGCRRKSLGTVKASYFSRKPIPAMMNESTKLN